MSSPHPVTKPEQELINQTSGDGGKLVLHEQFCSEEGKNSPSPSAINSNEIPTILNDKDPCNDQETSVSNKRKSDESDCIVGGRINEPAFAMLVGKYQDVVEPIETTLSVHITRLPAILGRRQTANNSHIFDLGNCKRLSRKHAVIFYCDRYGGRIGKQKFYDSDSNGDKNHKIDDEWCYQSRKSETKFDLIRNHTMKLPNQGFFAIECLSKNKIIVDGKRVDQGGVALLTNGSTIKMLTYTLYFILPQDAQPTEISVPNPAFEEDRGSDDFGPMSPSPLKRTKKENPFENKSKSELIDEFNSAIESGNFDRKASMISTQILTYAVEDCSHDPELRKACEAEKGISRNLLMDWIQASDIYGPYVTNLLTKVEIKSYQQNLSKAMIKRGYERIGNAGRHIKWILPKRTKIEEELSLLNPEKKEKAQKNDEEGNGSNSDLSSCEKDLDHTKNVENHEDNNENKAVKATDTENLDFTMNESAGCDSKKTLSDRAPNEDGDIGDSR